MNTAVDLQVPLLSKHKQASVLSSLDVLQFPPGKKCPKLVPRKPDFSYLTRSQGKVSFNLILQVLDKIHSKVGRFGCFYLINRLFKKSFEISYIVWCSCWIN